MKSKQRLLEALAQYDREVEPLAFLLRFDSRKLELKPLLDQLVSQVIRDHSDDPEFVDTIRGYMERIRKRTQAAAGK